MLGYYQLNLSEPTPVKFYSKHKTCHSRKYTLHWRHNDHSGVSNHQPRGCLLNRLFRRRSKETSKLRVTGLCVGNSPGPVNSPHKGPVTRKMLPFDDVIMHMKMAAILYRGDELSVMLWKSIILYWSIAVSPTNKHLFIYFIGNKVCSIKMV